MSQDNTFLWKKYRSERGNLSAAAITILIMLGLACVSPFISTGFDPYPFGFKMMVALKHVFFGLAGVLCGLLLKLYTKRFSDAKAAFKTAAGIEDED